MFEVPQAKRVRRSDLHSSASSRESSIDLDAREKLRIGRFFETATTETQFAHDGNGQLGLLDDAVTEDEDEIAFRLFAPTSTSSKQNSTQTIRIRSPTPQETEPGLIGAGRPKAYYLSGSLSPTLEAEYKQVAVSGADILARAKDILPGSAYQWKVTTIPRSRDIVGFHKLPDGVAVANSTTNPGKKARIKKRIRLAELRVKSEEQEKANEVKELAEREKKTRRNKEKQLKKRARDKAKRLAAGGTATQSVDGGEADDPESDAQSSGR